MKKFVAVVLLCMALAGMASGAGQAENNSDTCVGCNSDSANVTENQSETFIFIQEGSGGSLVDDGSGNYTLAMNDVVPYTVFFADRPARDVGFAPMDRFLNGFGFGDGNPPNAVIVLPEENETSDMLAVELTNPQYNNVTATLTYNARKLRDYSFESGWFKDQTGRVDASIPEKFGRIVLVIDDCDCTNVKSNECKTKCRNSCWQWKHFNCEQCGKCCSFSDCGWNPFF